MKEEVTKILQEYIDSMQAKGLTPTLEDLNLQIEKVVLEQNLDAKDSFEGYSPIEMETIIYYPFEINSPIQLNTLSSQEYNSMPIMRQIKRLTEIISQNGHIKLTPRGYLPVAIVRELYPLGTPDVMIDAGISKLYREAECVPVYLARIIAELSGILKNRKGELSLTAVGKKIIVDDSKLFEAIFKSFCLKYNWGFFDAYEHDKKYATIGQVGFGFTLILLSKYGNTKQLKSFYAKKYLEAFPMVKDTVRPQYSSVEEYCYNCYSIRTFDRFLLHFGLVEIKRSNQFSHDNNYIKKTPLFDNLISISSHNRLK